MRCHRALPFLLLSLSVPLKAQPDGGKITNGVIDYLHPTVGLFLLPDGECTATLIGCRTVLTAAHCICGDHLGGVECAARPDLVRPAGKSVFFQHAGSFALSGLAVSPAYDRDSGASDLAILHLAAPVTNIAPSPLNRTTPPPLDLTGEIVGFGSARTYSGDDGVKRRGLVKTAPCDPPAPGFVCWNFRAPLGPPGSNSDTCFGDSGGPLFLPIGGRTVLAGVTSSGTNPSCAPVDNFFDADVLTDLAWIEEQGGADLDSTSCGVGPQIGGPGTRVLGTILSLTRRQAVKYSSVEVPAGTAELRVSLLTADGFHNGNALYLRHGALASPKAFDCKADMIRGQQYCRVVNPAPGIWSILVIHLANSGSSVQVTSTLIGR
ncbi:MAG: trypsin-like serine protease [Thermoanaerobaculia bacterium]